MSIFLLTICKSIATNLTLSLRLIMHNQVNKCLDMYLHHIDVGYWQLHAVKDQWQFCAAQYNGLHPFLSDDAFCDLLERVLCLRQYFAKFQLCFDFRPNVASLLRIGRYYFNAAF